MKVHLQTQDFKNPQYRGVFDCVKSIIARDSVRGLYRGLSSPMTGVAFINGVVFGVYGTIQRHSSNPNSYLTHFWAGSTAGLIQSLIASPMELVKTRLQLQNNQKIGIKFHSPMQCLSYIYRFEGLRGVFKGVGITAIRDVPGFSSYFCSYEYLIRLHKDPGIFYTLMAGGLAGAISWVFVIPIDVAKSRIQADGMHGNKLMYNGMIDCFKKSYQQEGASFFTRGLSSTMLRAFPMNAVCFLVVSSILKFWDNRTISITVDRNIPHVAVKHIDCGHHRRKILQGLLYIGAFSEAVCSSEIIELANSWYDWDETDTDYNANCHASVGSSNNGNSAANYLHLNLQRKLELSALDNNISLIND